MNPIYVMGLDDIDRDTLDPLARFVSATFGFETAFADSVIDVSDAYDTERRQHSSVTLMRALLDTVPPDAAKLLAVTGCDIFIPMLTFVFGHAQLRGPVALVSLARLRQEFYGFESDKDLLLERARKEIAHELGHTFGLTHCAQTRCCMSLSTAIELVDRKSDAFCPGCLALLREAAARTRKTLAAGPGREVLS